ncbi:hypothetical protein Tco_1184616 [Tanacetum coccineum]
MSALKLLEVIVNGDSVSLVASASTGVEDPIPPKTAEQKLARKNELKAKSTLMLAFLSTTERLLAWQMKRFQKLISQLEIHGEVISKEDANLKLLRSLPSAWNNIALIMRNKSDQDTLSMDDLYNNMKLDYEDLEQINVDDLEEMDLKWQVAMLTIAKDKIGLGYDSQMNESEVVYSVFNNRESDVKCLTIEKEMWMIVQLDDYVDKRRCLVATKSGQVPDNAAKQNSPRATTSISTARTVNTATPKPKVNDALPTTYSYFKAHSPVRRPLTKIAAKLNNFNEKVNTAWVNNVTTTGPKAVVSAAKGNGENAVKSSTCWIWRPTGNVIDHTSKDSGSYMLKRFDYGNPQYTLQDQGIFDSGCSRHMTGNKSFLTDYQEINGGFELKFNLFSVSQMCDKKNSVLFTETEYLVLSPDFKLLDESQVLLKVPRHDNMYSFNLKNVVPSGGRKTKPVVSQACVALQPTTNVALDLFGQHLDDYVLLGLSFVVHDGMIRMGCRVHRAQRMQLLLMLVKRLMKNQQMRVKEMVKRRKEELQIKKVTRMLNNVVIIVKIVMDCVLLVFRLTFCWDTTVSPSVSDAGQSFDNADLPTDSLMPDLEDTVDLQNTGIFSGAYNDEDEGAEADLNNLETTMNFSHVPKTKIHKYHPKDQIIGNINSATQTRRMTKIFEEHDLVSYINKQRRTNHKDYQNCLFPCFLFQKEPKKVIQALDDPSWIEAMQEELL